MHILSINLSLFLSHLHFASLPLSPSVLAISKEMALLQIKTKIKRLLLQQVTLGHLSFISVSDLTLSQFFKIENRIFLDPHPVF